MTVAELERERELLNAIANAAPSLLCIVDREGRVRPFATNKAFAWTPDDYKVSETFQAYFSNFVKTGDPNGAGVPPWPPANRGDAVSVMHIDVDTRAEPEQHRDRYLFLDQIYKSQS